jgi:alkanesulfonate monooxygenase SsuD/methylene tetrahydromethanopterin reductase-like flavin-dependent oxidoreductase (luciferase family)
LVSAADATDLRVGTWWSPTTCSTLRLAQEAATFDLLVDGRLELGLGAGWNRHEYEVPGVPYDRPARRVVRLREAVKTMKAGLGRHGPAPRRGRRGAAPARTGGAEDELHPAADRVAHRPRPTGRG